ncbi:MAG: hypothetical protein HKN24_04630 [Acidimicrobiales bacterium]|nr:hypothetical protein [Acidimicrobiales bacterium]
MPSFRSRILAASTLAAVLTVPVGAPASGETVGCDATIGGVDLGCLADNLFVFTNGSGDANWQASSKGYVGDVAVSGAAKFRTSGHFAYSGTISTDGDTIGKWHDIVADNEGQASSAIADSAVSGLSIQLDNAITQAASLPATPGFESVDAADLAGLNTQNGSPDVVVINVTDKMTVKDQLVITGDETDAFVIRWDEDADAANGFQGKVKFQSGGAIIPAGGLTPGNFVHVAGDISSSGGGDTPAGLPQGPRSAAGDLIEGGEDFDGGGFFTGYWLTTGKPGDGKTSSLSNAIFVGGWYTSSTKFSLTSGSSGVHVAPPVTTTTTTTTIHYTL